METNIRIVEPGIYLTIEINKIKLVGNSLSSEQINSICSKLGNYYGISAVPFIENKLQYVVINTAVDIPSFNIDVQAYNSNEKWEIGFKKSDSLTYSFRNIEDRQIIADLYRKQLLLNIAHKNFFWRIGDSNRIFYEIDPFFISNDEFKDIEAYRRYKLSDVIIAEAGLGFSLEVETGFFSGPTVDDYFKTGNIKRFEQLINRQGEFKGTLIFESPNKVTKAYFERFEEGLTCGTVRSFSINGNKYENLVDYYKGYSKYSINENDTVAIVSFPKVGKKPVPAKKLRLRIFNEMLPSNMRDLDKINPEERRKLLIKFWDQTGSNLFGKNYSYFSKYKFYRPLKNTQGIIKLPSLKFGIDENNNNVILNPPEKVNAKTYSQNYWKRKKLLDKYGCFHVPPIIDREIYIPYPNTISNELMERFSLDICSKLSSLTKNEIQPILLPYSNYSNAIYQLKNDSSSGTSLFVFNNSDSATYFNISYELEGWGIKRVTEEQLIKKYHYLKKGDERGKKSWHSFTDIVSYDIIQQMDCVPWVINTPLNYEMHLAIDVSEDYSHFTLSLMIYTIEMKFPIFKTDTHRKIDTYSETINPEFLKEYFIELFKSEKCLTALRKYKPKSLLIYRDGKNCKDEFKALKSGIQELQKSSLQLIDNTLKLDFIEYHKSISKEIRMWHNGFNNQISNVIEGSFFLLDNTSAILSSTGEGTLTQGTSDPIQINLRFTKGDLNKIIEDIFYTSQLNFSNPITAQRLSLPLKRADELLKEKRAQEIKVK
ncbi:MAG: hypothetical protein JXA68_10605 [Ignavibacteriales bacterium]|nr:hypothetical protein [Ignavibacteriales bacterium]